MRVVRHPTVVVKDIDLHRVRAGSGPLCSCCTASRILVHRSHQIPSHSSGSPSICVGAPSQPLHATHWFHLSAVFLWRPSFLARVSRVPGDGRAQSVGTAPRAGRPPGGPHSETVRYLGSCRGVITGNASSCSGANPADPTNSRALAQFTAGPGAWANSDAADTADALPSSSGESPANRSGPARESVRASPRASPRLAPKRSSRLRLRGLNDRNDPLWRAAPSPGVSSTRLRHGRPDRFDNVGGHSISLLGRRGRCSEGDSLRRLGEPHGRQRCSHQSP